MVRPIWSCFECYVGTKNIGVFSILAEGLFYYIHKLIINITYLEKWHVYSCSTPWEQALVFFGLQWIQIQNVMMYIFY